MRGVEKGSTLHTYSQPPATEKGLQRTANATTMLPTAARKKLNAS